MPYLYITLYHFRQLPFKKRKLSKHSIILHLDGYNNSFVFDVRISFFISSWSSKVHFYPWSKVFSSH